MARTTPVVRGKILTWSVDSSEHQLYVGTPAWYTWLEGLLALPADALLTPGALDTVVPLLPRREARRECAKFGHEVVILFP